MNMIENTSRPGLVKISATWSDIMQYTISMNPFGFECVLTCCLKWWYLIAVCFVRGVNFGLFAMAMQDWLSSCTRTINFGFRMWSLKITSISRIKFIRRIISLRVWGCFFLCGEVDILPLNSYVGYFSKIRAILADRIYFTAGFDSRLSHC